MEHHNPGKPTGCGRGRPRENTDLRRPHVNTYASGDADFVPSAGVSNGVVFCGAPTNWGNETQKADTTVPASPSGDHVRSAVPWSICSGESPTVTNSEKKFTLSPYAEEFVPRYFRPEPRVLQTEIPEENTINNSMDSYVIQELRSFLADLTFNPGKFERRIQPLTDTINEMVDDEDTLRAIVNIIFDESVRQPNFRYSGARLCKYLSSELTWATEQGNFRSLLLQRCTQEHKRREQLAKAEDGGVYLRGFAMFLAELFSQLEVSKQKISLFSEHLSALMKTLLDHPSSDNLKSVCQILKLVGVYLEDFGKTSNQDGSNQMDKIISSMKNLTGNPEIGRDIKDMVNSVIELRSIDWGRSTSTYNSDTTSSDTSSYPLNEPVMYGPDGKPITAEESLFLHSQYGCHSIDGEEYEYYEDTTFDEFDDDVEEAFELFLSEQELRH